MLNIDDFIKRIETLLDYYSISASVFADKLGVQRSGLSHLLSGRNKPSLDFVMKITENFPEVDLYWLLDGSGEFPKKEQAHQIFAQPIAQQPSAPALLKTEPGPEEMPDLFSATAEVPQQPAVNEEKIIRETETGKSITITHAGEIERIVVFYKNGVFKNYNPGH